MVHREIMKIGIVVSILAAIHVGAAVVRAEVRLPEIFASKMVLQRDRPVPVWGWAAPGEEVVVSIDGQSRSAVTDDDGRWNVELASLKAGGPFTMTVKAANTLTLEDVLVGDVWLCSGQSNMEWRMSAFSDTAGDVEQSANPNIRFFQPELAWNQEPQDHLKATWTSCEPGTVKAFSATGYYFGKNLQENLDIPIGLINSSWGGTRIEPWIAPIGLESVVSLEAIAQAVAEKNPRSSVYRESAAETVAAYKKWTEEAEARIAESETLPPVPPMPRAIEPFRNQQAPTVLYNTMIHPFVPLAIKGTIWYQGESNRGEGMLYAEKMKALIQGWRAVFKNDDMPFYYVQLAPFNYGNDPEALAEIWEAQAAVENAIENTGMVVINDIGNLANIHPLQKNVVGKRLADLALNRTYGKKEIACDFPAFRALTLEGNTAVVSFKNADSLSTRDGKAPDWFEIAGVNGEFKAATAKIEGATIRLSNPAVEKPFLVRFAWSMMAEPNLQNEAGLPAGAFRAGEIPERGNLDALVPQAKNYELVYSFDPINPVMTRDKTRMVYKTDKSKDFAAARIKRVGYFLFLKQKSGDDQFVFVSMPPLADDIVKLGVPTKASGARFMQKVADVTVYSNVPGVETGTFAEGCNVEFCDCNFGRENEQGIPGASDTIFDFGDALLAGASPGYGSMQVHHYARKHPIFAFNNFSVGNQCDIGIGNCPGAENLDWTFSRSALRCLAGQFLILVETE